MNPDRLVDSILGGGAITEAEALTLLSTPDTDLLTLVNAGSRLRREHFGMTIKLNYLVNLKSGMCPESCTCCSQSLGSKAEILRYSWLSIEGAMDQAGKGIDGGASRVCLVASGRGPSRRDVDRVGAIVERLKDENPEVEVCACLGILKNGQAETLKGAGADAYNHNINTSESFHDNIVRTHSYDDRTNTVELAKSAGLSPCSGLIVGLGESDEQIVEALFALKELESDSIPINFLVPFDGTIRLPRPRDPPGRRPRDPSQVPAADGAAPGEFDLPRRLPHRRRSGRCRRPRHDPRQRLHDPRPGRRMREGS